ncbi:MAG: class I SAM-dependent methyltransferase [Candidatus Melainabacteria bacterium]|nr:class I SAM-dependent methyltransferase [Candidatus Melainabacteria bacterium]
MSETENASPQKKSSNDYGVAYIKTFPDDLSKFKGLLDDFLRTVPAKSKVLDIGCSNGSYVAYLLKQGYDAFGIDISLSMLEEAKKHVPSERLFLMDMHTMEDLGESTFDAVLSITSMLYANKEYLPRVLKQVHRLLKPGGKFLLMMLEGEGDGLIKHSNGESEVVTYTTYYEVDELKQRVKAGGFEIDQERLSNLVVSSHAEISLFCTKQANNA